MNLPFKHIDVDVDIESNEEPQENILIETLERRVSVKNAYIKCVSVLLAILFIPVIVIIIMLQYY